MQQACEGLHNTGANDCCASLPPRSTLKVSSSVEASCTSSANQHTWAFTGRVWQEVTFIPSTCLFLVIRVRPCKPTQQDSVAVSQDSSPLAAIDLTANPPEAVAPPRPYPRERDERTPRVRKRSRRGKSSWRTIRGTP